LTRSPGAKRADGEVRQDLAVVVDAGDIRGRLVSLPARPAVERARVDGGAGVRYVVEYMLPLEQDALAAACRRWSATAVEGDALTRAQARQVWALRLALPGESRDRFDELPFTMQAQLAELYAEIWSPDAAAQGQDERGA
jgi:hypothetical protein